MFEGISGLAFRNLREGTLGTKLVEELGELMDVVERVPEFKNFNTSRELRQRLVEEMADALVMILQAQEALGARGELEAMVRYKIARTESEHARGFEKEAEDAADED
jgi:NTP pyrophosphatase (non-canonical NTP hydrolase)